MTSTFQTAESPHVGDLSCSHTCVHNTHTHPPTHTHTHTQPHAHTEACKTLVAAQLTPCLSAVQALLPGVLPKSDSLHFSAPHSACVLPENPTRPNRTVPGCNEEISQTHTHTHTHTYTQACAN